MARAEGPDPSRSSSPSGSELTSRVSTMPPSRTSCGTWAPTTQSTTAGSTSQRTIQPYDLILDLVAHRSVSAYRRALAPGGTYRCVGGSVRSLLRVSVGRGGRAVQRPLHRGARRQGGPGALRAPSRLMRCRGRQHPHRPYVRPRRCSRRTGSCRRGSRPRQSCCRNVLIGVGDTGIEPVTSSVSRKRSPTELIAPRRRRESNPRTGLCRPLPKPLGHSAGPRHRAREPRAPPSGRRDSNPRPSPWQGDALPTEPRPRATGKRPEVRVETVTHAHAPSKGSVMTERPAAAGWARSGSQAGDS